MYNTTPQYFPSGYRQAPWIASIPLAETLVGENSPRLADTECGAFSLVFSFLYW